VLLPFDARRGLPGLQIELHGRAPMRILTHPVHAVALDPGHGLGAHGHRVVLPDEHRVPSEVHRGVPARPAPGGVLEDEQVVLDTWKQPPPGNRRLNAARVFRHIWYMSPSQNTRYLAYTWSGSLAYGAAKTSALLPVVLSSSSSKDSSTGFRW
jgi:hypothetical protein